MQESAKPRYRKYSCSTCEFYGYQENDDQYVCSPGIGLEPVFISLNKQSKQEMTLSGFMALYTKPDNFSKLINNWKEKFPAVFNNIVRDQIKLAVDRTALGSATDLIEAICISARRFYTDTPLDFCVKKIGPVDITFGVVNIVVWSPETGFVCKPSYATPDFIRKFTEINGIRN